MQHNDGSATHTVIGVHVVLKKGDPNGLWDSLNVDRASQKIDGNNPQVAVRALSTASLPASFTLISTCTSYPFVSTTRGHFYLGQRGHYCLGVTPACAAA